MEELSRRPESGSATLKLPEDFRALSNAILTCANRGEPKVDFLREIAEMIINFSGCDGIRIIFKENGGYSLCNAFKHGDIIDIGIEPYPPAEYRAAETLGTAAVETIARDVLHRDFDPALPFFTAYGSFWTGNADEPLSFGQAHKAHSHFHGLVIGGIYKSHALIPIAVVADNLGLLHLLSAGRNAFSKFDLPLYETVSQALGVALINQHVQAALRERVKELTCLYGIATLAKQPNISSHDALRGIAELLPPAWQYPEMTNARIAVDDYEFKSPNFQNGIRQIVSRIIVDGKDRGFVEVSYSKPMPELDEGPFLKEERKLIDTVAAQAGLLIEQKQAEEERVNLQNQLRHADRLATIGQLAAGVAHELNEPLGTILGFAELACKKPGIDKQLDEDLHKIINAALHAREVVKKLMLFSRQMPTRKTLVDLNKVVKEGLYFLESRCAKAGIDMVRSVADNLPRIEADQSQINQVLVNLAVNAVQAMPDGGKLTIKTEAHGGDVLLVVEDTGIGMDREVQSKLFMPFFTTKDVNEGTGLGLSVVHGIVTSHGGRIAVKSRVGEGSRFEIAFPAVTEKKSEGHDD
jgi:signal transduction histidine kinase